MGFAAAIGLVSLGRANEPDGSTNSAGSTFLENHPELTEPAQPSLSLRPNAGAGNAPPLVSAPGAEIFPDTLHASTALDGPEDLAAHLLVVYNTNDPDSRALAEYYAARRGIPVERVLAITCPTAEQINRAQYENTIREPIVSYLIQKNWMERQMQRVQVGNGFLDLLVATRNDIWAIVLMRGVPLKIAPDPSEADGMQEQKEFQTNAAAVDNELALLPIFGLPKGGFVPNIFFDNQVSGIKRVGPELAKNMVLVTRLDGPTPADVRRMIDDCLYAETHRLAGLAVVDTRGITDVRNGYLSGDVWLRSARDSLLKDGWTVQFDDKPGVLPATDPCNQVALYLGWYSETAEGPWVTSPDRFVPGAIAYHLHSFSATTIRSETKNWVGPLIAHGADATMGMVYEPYLPLTPHEDIFARRLLHGDYFAEAAYASEAGLSWMLTVVGDPLYRPFLQPLESNLAAAGVPHTEHDDWLLLQKVQRDILAGRIKPKAANLKRFLDVPGAGPVAEEGLADLLAQLNEPFAGSSVEQAYRKAMARATAPIDKIRIGLKLAQYDRNHGNGGRADQELAALRQLYPDDAQRFGASGLPPSSPSAIVNKPIYTPAPTRSSSGPKPPYTH